MGMYVEHNKLLAVRFDSQTICEFLEWLGEEKGYHIAEHDHLGRSLPVREKTEDLLAEFFDIDRDKIEEEKRQMIEAATGISQQ